MQQNTDSNYPNDSRGKGGEEDAEHINITVIEI